MTVLLCTAKYRKVFALGETFAATGEERNGLLGPWYANTLSIGPQRYLHYMSDRTLLPIIIWLRERRTAEQRMAEALAHLLSQSGVHHTAIEIELAALASPLYGRASDRSRLASMRDQTISAKNAVRAGRSFDAWGLTVDLADMPTGTLAYRTPRSKTAEMLGRSERLGA